MHSVKENQTFQDQCAAHGILNDFTSFLGPIFKYTRGLEETL